MSYCKCGGYLGSGGIDGYAGRWCQCANPTKQYIPTITSTEITLPRGTYEVSSTLLGAENPFIKINKTKDAYVTLPKHSFWERLKYLFTGDLKGVQIRVMEIK